MDSLTIIFILNGVFFISFFFLKNIYIPLGLSLLTLFVLLLISKQKKIPSIPTGFKLPSLAFNNRQYIITITCLVIFFILGKFIGFNAALFTGFFIFSYLNKLDSRAGFFIALILLVITALLNAGGNTHATEDTAVLAYLFLVIGVIWQIIELRNIKPVEDVNSESDEGEIKIIAKKEVFRRSSSSYNNIFLIRSALIVSVLVFFSFITIFLVKQLKPPVVNKPIIKKQIVNPVITPMPKRFTHASLVILNATDTRGLAGSSAAILREDGWQKEFDISTGNYMGDEILSANIFKYTKNFEDKVSLIERSLNIRVTPILLKEATQEAELTLILGK